MVIINKFNWIYLLLTGALAGGCVAKGETTDHKPTIPTVPVTQVIRKDTVLHQDYVANIQAVRHIEVRARVKGFLDNVYVDEGQQVRKGQPLFRISSEEYKAELAKAKANLNSAIAEAKAAELDVARVQLLVDKKVISKSELEVSKAKLQAAQARIEEARSAQDNAATKLGYTYIKAPFSGTIDRLPLKVGSLINEGALLTTLADLDQVYAYFNVSEKEYLKYLRLVQQGADTRSKVVELILADGTPYPQKGKIETMESEFEASTGSIAFRAKFPNPDRMLKHFSSGRVRLTNDVDEALFLPQKAAFEVQDKSFVYVVDRHNKVQIKNFKPQSRLSHFYIVDSGLEPGDKVVYEGVQEIREGMEINPSFIPMDSLLSSPTAP
jgi:membrane fusion protein, multidrug efflux system